MPTEATLIADPAIPPLALAGPKINLLGPSGSGKTWSIGTLVDWAAKQSPPRPVYVLFIESGLETLLGYWVDRNLPVPANLRYHVVKTKTTPLSALLTGAKMVGAYSYESITKWSDPERGASNPYEKILTNLTDFPDDRTGKKHGNIGDWKNTDILVIDSLSELAWACMKMVIGAKPTASPSDFGVAQNNLMNFLRYITQGFAPTVVVTAHVQRQTDEVTGSVKLMTKAIGKAMADDIPQLFSEVIGTVRDGSKWFWDTANPGLDTKTRYLPIASKIEPNFAQIMDKWAKRGASV